MEYQGHVGHQVCSLFSFRADLTPLHKSTNPQNIFLQSRHRFRVDLNFNNPVKELVWVIQNEFAESSANKFLTKTTNLS